MPKPEQPVAKNAMPDEKRIAGVVLAGGRSSRMGRDKALLDYNGIPLVDHMVALLKKAGRDNVYISGRMGETCASTGCHCLQDSAPFAGPAAAIRDVLNRLNDYDGVLFVPVDMPFLTQSILRELLQYESGAHYQDWPLPLYLPTSQKTGHGDAVKTMLSTMSVKVVPLPQEDQARFANINTPEEWKEAIGK